MSPEGPLALKVTYIHVSFRSDNLFVTLKSLDNGCISIQPGLITAGLIYSRIGIKWITSANQWPPFSQVTKNMCVC